MDFKDLQTAVTLVVMLSAAAPIVFYDYRRKEKIAAQQSGQMLHAVEVCYAPVRSRTERETVTVEMASPSPAAPVTLPALTIDAMVWERQIASPAPEKRIERKRPLLLGSTSTIEATHQMIRNVSPSPQPMIEDLLERRELFTGLVLSISVNDFDSSMWHSQGLMQSIGNYLTGLLNENDFSSRTAYDEFVILCPDTDGAQSQRRLNLIAEQLWEYQLRGIGASAILFSWGAVHVQDEPLAEAIAAATERMCETRRTGPSRYALALRQTV